MCWLETATHTSVLLPMLTLVFPVPRTLWLVRWSLSCLILSLALASTWNNPRPPNLPSSPPPSPASLRWHNSRAEVKVSPLRGIQSCRPKGIGGMCRDAEVMIPFVENPELTEVSSFKAWSRPSEYSRACFAHCQEFLLCPNFDFPGPFSPS